MIYANKEDKILTKSHNCRFCGTRIPLLYYADYDDMIVTCPICGERDRRKKNISL